MLERPVKSVRGALEAVALPSSRCTSPMVLMEVMSTGCASRRRWIRRWPQFGDPPQNLANSIRGTATSAIWKAKWRPWLTTLAPILIGFSFRLVSDQCLIGSGVASVRRKSPGL